MTQDKKDTFIRTFCYNQLTGRLLSAWDVLDSDLPYSDRKEWNDRMLLKIRLALPKDAPLFKTLENFKSTRIKTLAALKTKNDSENKSINDEIESITKSTLPGGGFSEESLKKLMADEDVSRKAKVLTARGRTGLLKDLENLKDDLIQINKAFQEATENADIDFDSSIKAELLTFKKKVSTDLDTLADAVCENNKTLIPILEKSAILADLGNKYKNPDIFSANSLTNCREGCKKTPASEAGVVDLSDVLNSRNLTKCYNNDEFLVEFYMKKMFAEATFNTQSVGPIPCYSRTNFPDINHCKYKDAPDKKPLYDHDAFLALATKKTDTVETTVVPVSATIPSEDKTH